MTLGAELYNGDVFHNEVSEALIRSPTQRPTQHPVADGVLKTSLASTRPVSVPDRSAFSTDDAYKAFVERTLSDYNVTLSAAKRQQLGYPIYHAKDNVEELDLTPLERFSAAYINNVGDPWENAGAFASHSHGFEVGVLEWFAELFELGKESFWGYISSGGSESKSVLNCLPPTPRSP
jgi:hypothetical protein